ncbi:hypothetical protein CUC08_Gglean013542 [Alternaria sp. MG1]|nr:hypothetical protein CUC08_Gglean013542 [Alternaria sp. MG1]
MKLVTSILLAFAVSAQASWCNDGWGLPANTGCPDSYPHSFCCGDGDDARFPHERTCAQPVRNGLYVQDSCSGGFIKCVRIQKFDLSVLY